MGRQRWGQLTDVGAESRPGARPTSTSDLDPSVCGVVCPSPMARLVDAPTIAAAPTARSGRMMEVLTLA